MKPRRQLAWQHYLWRGNGGKTRVRTCIYSIFYYVRFVVRLRPLPLFFPQSHSHNTSQPAQDARHAMQIVDSTGVLDTQARRQDGLQRRKQDLLLQPIECLFKRWNVHFDLKKKWLHHITTVKFHILPSPSVSLPIIFSLIVWCKKKKSQKSAENHSQSKTQRYSFYHHRKIHFCFKDYLND